MRVRRLLAVATTLAISAALAVPAGAVDPPPTGIVTGFVYYGSTGVDPAAGSMVTACKTGSFCSSSATSGADGAFTLNNVPLDTDHLEAYPPSSSPQRWFRGSSTTIVVTAAGPNTADVRLVHGGRASGTVFEPNGTTPVPAGTAVQYENANLPVFYESMGISTGVGGTYVTPWLRPGGTLTMSAGPSSIGTRVSSAGLPLVANEEKVVNLTLAGGGGWLAGTVNGNGTALAGASVSASGIPRAMTDSSGAYRTLAMPAGSVTVFVQQPFGANFLSASQTVTVGTGANPTNFDLAVGGILTGSVTGANGSPLASGWTQACTSPSQCAYGSVSSGSYTLAGLVSGTYTLRITMPTSGPPSPGAPPAPFVEQTGLSVIAGETTTQNMAFDAGGADTTVPTISGAPDRPANGAGWYGQSVTLTFTCSDAGSGIQSCTSPQTLSGEGTGQQVTGTAVDYAGNTATATVSGINIDRTAPIVTIGGVTDGASYVNGSVPGPSCSATDALSGVNGSCSGLGPFGGNPDGTGSFTYAATAGDRAGNATTTFAYYTVTVAPGEANEEVTGGEVVTTDPDGLGATPEVPIQTDIVVPDDVSGSLSVTIEDSGGTPPPGYTFFDQQVTISGPVAPDPLEPYIVTFTIDEGSLGGLPLADVHVFRNNVLVETCTGPGAQPDPCVVPPGAVADPGGSGDAVITVRTTAFSTWIAGKVESNCTTTIVGSTRGSRTVAAGDVLCVANGTVTGSILVNPGGSLIVSDAVIKGSISVGSDGVLSVRNAKVGGFVTSSGAHLVTVCGSTVGSSVSISSSTGFVLFGGDGDDCAKNNVRGNIYLQDNTGGLEAFGNVIGGSVVVVRNTVGSVIGANNISGSLSCTSNTPGPTNNGARNKVRGSRSGQCSSRTF